MRFSTNEIEMIVREKAEGRAVSPRKSRRFPLRAEFKVVKRKLHDGWVLLNLTALRHRQHVRDFGLL
jgi:hypothetical protein